MRRKHETIARHMRRHMKKRRGLKPGQLVGLRSVSRHLDYRTGPITLPRKVISITAYHSRAKHKNLSRPYRRTRNATTFTA
jgi:hypothetical protein